MKKSIFWTVLNRILLKISDNIKVSISSFGEINQIIEKLFRLCLLFLLYWFHCRMLHLYFKMYQTNP